MCRTIPFISTCALLFFTVNSYPADKLNQRTEGDQAPAVNVSPGGNLNIYYGASGDLVANVVPEIICNLKYPFKVEKGSVLKQFNPEITITNVGPIEAVAFSVDLKMYIYDKRRAVIEGYTELSMLNNGHFIFKKEFQPADEITRQVGGYRAQNKIAIYSVSLKYYRRADMKVFNRQEMFFMENFEIKTEKDYAKNADYPGIILAIKSYKPSPDIGKNSLLGIDDHSWVLSETQESGLIVLGAGGKSLTISGIPEDLRSAIKRNSVGENRPLLYIKPSKQKETGTYLNPKIVSNDMVNVAFRYEIENIGDLKAVRVSGECGTPFRKQIMPGEKIYINSGATAVRKSGGDETVQELISNIDKDDFFVEHHSTVRYFRESPDEEYIVRFVYKIGKNSVQLIKYEIN